MEKLTYFLVLQNSQDHFLNQFDHESYNLKGELVRG